MRVRTVGRIWTSRLALFLLAVCSVGLADEPKAKPRRTFRLESSDVLLGEPILVEFRVEMDGPGVWEEPVGGSSRGMGRIGEGKILMRHEDGSWVPDIFEGVERMSFGGTGGYAQVEKGKPHVEWYAVQQWCAIERPGVYQLYAFGWGPGTLPKVGQSIPADVKAKHKTAELACDFAQFKLTVRQGNDQERRAMVERWTRRVRNGRDHERNWAARTAMALARQDDFLPELKRRLWDEDRTPQGVVYMGLAMRDDPRAVDLLFEAGGSQTIEAMSLLRPSQVPAAIPRLIDRLTDPDHVTRAQAEEVLRGWTGQKFGHIREGYKYNHPTFEEGRRMQSMYREWWIKNKEGFRPVFRPVE